MNRRLAPVICVTFSAGGCGAPWQSALSPAGEQAGQIAQLSWGLFALGAVVLLIVMIAVWLAIRGSAKARAILSSERSIIALGIVWPAVTLTLLLAYGIWLMRPAFESAPHSEAVRIEIVGEQWWWRIKYLRSGGEAVASANELRMPVGQPTEIVLSSADVIHSFWVPALGGKVDMVPGRITRLRLQATRPGIYRGQCAEYCGGPHALMAIQVIAMPAEDFSAWLAREAAIAVAPATDSAQRGAALFQSAGCGACHTIRGTAANGTVGPDLTHLGSRRSVGVDTLTLTAQNIQRFITHGQAIKPGNHMPEFRIFAADEVEAVGSYLAGLR
jgi:cytochrome c oxidase subunit 2